MHRSPASLLPRARSHGLLIAVVFTFVAAISLEGCGTTRSAGDMGTTVPTTAAAQATTVVTAAMDSSSMRSDAAEAWATRPDFTRVSADTEEAYAYALFKPSIVEWMPCYCGCARMDHRSNLDCYLKPAVAGQKTQFEEHASYCDICVQITLTTKRLVAEGKSLREIRQAVDQQFGGSVPGTPTELPPA